MKKYFLKKNNLFLKFSKLAKFWNFSKIVVNRQSVTLTFKIQKLQIICKKTSKLASKLDKNLQSYGKLKNVHGLLGHPLDSKSRKLVIFGIQTSIWIQKNIESKSSIQFQKQILVSKSDIRIQNVFWYPDPVSKSGIQIKNPNRQKNVSLDLPGFGVRIHKMHGIHRPNNIFDIQIQYPNPKKKFWCPNLGP